MNIVEIEWNYRESYRQIKKFLSTLRNSFICAPIFTHFNISIEFHSCSHQIQVLFQQFLDTFNVQVFPTIRSNSVYQDVFPEFFVFLGVHVVTGPSLQFYFQKKQSTMYLGPRISVVFWPRRSFGRYSCRMDAVPDPRCVQNRGIGAG